MIPPNTILQNRYRIIRQLGQGGMGTVYEALDQRVSAIVALKQTNVATDDKSRRDFEREAGLLANLHHQALPKVMDYFIEDDREFLVMEYIPGYDLAELLELRGNPFDVYQVLRWADELLKVLEYLHGRTPPILHRDIKPSNLKLTKQGEIFLLDFGLAKGAAGQMPTMLTSRSVRGYTPVYASLEQIMGQGTDPRSDLYSLGATLYEFLTHTLPTDAPTRDEHLEDDKPDPLKAIQQLNPQVPSGVAEVIHQAMSIRRKNRPESAAAMRRALRHAEDDAKQAVEAERRQREEAEHQRALEEAHRQAEEQRLRLEAEETARRTAEMRQRREAEETQRAEEEQRRQAEKEEAHRVAEEQRRKEEERARAEEEARKEASLQFLHQLAAKEAERRQAEEDHHRAEHERMVREAEEAKRKRAAELEEERTVEAQRTAAAITQSAQESTPSDSPPVKTIKAPPPERVVISDGESTPLVVAPAGRNKRAMLIGVIALGALVIVVAVMLMRRGESNSNQSSNVNQTQTGQESNTSASNSNSVATPSPVQAVTPPADMAYVLGGEFTMGRDDGDEYERPAHQVKVNPFYIDLYEVTREDYQKCVDEKKCQPPPVWRSNKFPDGTAKLPITGVTWGDANAYASWAGKRLPTEEEWEFAARGGKKEFHYPWGNEWKDGLANANSASNGLAEVGSYKGASPFGVFDMVGNAWEWTASKLTAYKKGQPLPNKPPGDLRVIRGGSYIEDKNEATTTYRRGYPVSGVNYDKTGFRCAKDITNSSGQN